MDMQTRAQTQRSQDLWRLCHQAERRGIRILCEPSTMQHFSTSATDPTVLYRVSESGCSCKGFRAWQRCQHFALFLASLGAIPDETPALATCPTCGGRGFDPACTGHAVAGMTIHCPCYGCDGAGTVAVDVVINEYPAVAA